MTEFRQDPVIGQWSIVEIDNSWPPERFPKEDHFLRQKATCQFCPGHEHQTPPEIEAIRDHGAHPNSTGWKVRVVPNKFPALKIEGDINLEDAGVFSRSNGVGAHEVLIETPDHEKHLADFSVDEFSDVLTQYRSRINDLEKDKRFKYVVVFRNYGDSAGATLEHPHSQIIALPMIPKYVVQKLEGAQEYYNQYQSCAFCDMLKQEVKNKERIVTENSEFTVFCPYVPRYPFECWIMPKKHHMQFADISSEDQRSLAGIFKETLLRIKKCLDNPSYNYYLHVSPFKYDHPESFHWHIEIVPKLTQFSGFEWGTGIYVVRTEPGVAAQYLREVSL